MNNDFYEPNDWLRQVPLPLLQIALDAIRTRSRFELYSLFLRDFASAADDPRVVIAARELAKFTDDVSGSMAAQFSALLARVRRYVIIEATCEKLERLHDDKEAAQ